MRFHDLHPSLPTWIASLEEELTTLFQEEFPLLRDACLAMIDSRGKRLRPILLLLSCACFGEVTSRAFSQGCLVELVHTASLIHDDVVDEADSRRGLLSARARWNNKFAVLLGDFVLARVFELVAKDGDPEILRSIAPAATAMGRGVILELTNLRIDADEDTYWQVVFGKTAALFASAMEIGAIIGGGSLADRRMMAHVGKRFGTAFQLADDLLDLQGTENATGKPMHADWKQQRATLPLLYAVHHASPSTVERIRSLWDADPFTEAHLNELCSLVEAVGGFRYCWNVVTDHLVEAAGCLQSLPASAARTALINLCKDRFPLPVLPTAT